ncbi:hypothetical protein [Microvirga massiliensis]|uniref:hypothetical protein n=1 Tax=Microvirga massiliensis TaxID=1033741 RepID=UPI00062BD6AE|nr:hypothetical protein [Microvirga massiliensis]
MSIWLPRNVAIAAESFEVLSKNGAPVPIGRRSMANVLVLYSFNDPAGIEPGEPGWASARMSVWARPDYGGYKAAWDEANREHKIGEANDWAPLGEVSDIDHVYPQSWTTLPGKEVAYVRLYPVWSSVNRSLGARDEKRGLNNGSVKPLFRGGIAYADKYQVFKMLGVHAF